MLGITTCSWCRGEGGSRTSHWASILLPLVIGCSVCLSAAESDAQSGPPLSWGQRYWKQQGAADEQYVALAAGAYHSLGLTTEGSLVAWGENYNGQCNSPYGNSFVAIASGFYHNVALRSDGSIVVWGDNTWRQCQPPAAREYLAIGAGDFHSVAIRSDGSLVAWGWNEYGQCDVPAGNDYTAVAAGRYHSLALKLDRSIVAWGGNGDWQCAVPEGGDFIAVSAGSLHSLALKSDGSLVAWGRNDQGQCDVPEGGDFVAISAGAFHNLALRSDGAVVAWGLDTYSQCEVPADTYAAMVAAGGFHSLAIGAERKDVAGVEMVAADAGEGTEPVTVQPSDANAVAAQAPTPDLAETIDPNAGEPADATVAAPADVNDASQPEVAGAQPAESEDRSAEVASDTEATSPPQDAGAATAVLYGSIESYGCIDQDDPRARPVYHFTSETLTPHFYTISKEERDKLIDESPDIWTYEGRAFNAFPEGQQPEGAIPVYRFWSDLLGTHFYTMSEQEKDAFIKDYPDLCTYQGIAWYTDKLPPSEPVEAAPRGEP
ncbi:MAG: hypothetical protein JSW27_21660 [Phycisphaerales bacterium]|nr:MAG: hypothetical protein JSW27_21660 [Phycisphaerales bacterium]